MKMLMENVPCGGISCNDTVIHAAGKLISLQFISLNGL